MDDLVEIEGVDLARVVAGECSADMLDKFRESGRVIFADCGSCSTPCRLGVALVTAAGRLATHAQIVVHDPANGTSLPRRGLAAGGSVTCDASRRITKIEGRRDDQAGVRVRRPLGGVARCE